jgi:stage II sporulation protein D
MPTVDPSPTPTPDPGLWIATVYDSLGSVLATTTTPDLVVEAAEPNGILRMAYRDELPKYTTYRGKMRLLVTPTGLQTINILPLESYLRGVVPAEVPASWPTEAVKAQAVAARTYAWAKMKDARAWHIQPTAANQVYGGYQHERYGSDFAVAATQNLVLTYGGSVISALYHAAAGGHTENSEYAFVNDRGDPGSRVGYLRGKADVDENGVPYDSTAGSYAWNSGQFTMSQLSAFMGMSTLTDVGDIYSITYSRGVSGRVYRVVLVGSEGTKTMSGGRFKNIFNNHAQVRHIKSTMYYLTPVGE